jgi:DNA-binding response OmpR family regulator
VELEAVSSYQNFETMEAADGPTRLRALFNVHPDFAVASLSVHEMPVWNVITRIRDLSDTLIIESTLTSGFSAAFRW